MTLFQLLNTFQKISKFVTISWRDSLIWWFQIVVRVTCSLQFTGLDWNNCWMCFAFWCFCGRVGGQWWFWLVFSIRVPEYRYVSIRYVTKLLETSLDFITALNRFLARGFIPSYVISARFSNSFQLFALLSLSCLSFLLRLFVSISIILCIWSMLTKWIHKSSAFHFNYYFNFIH